MTQSPPPRLLTRRRLGALILGVPLVAGFARPPRRPIVTILGDSITAGLGLPAADALPARLQAALTKAGIAATVRGAGVSGDTTAAGLARVDFSVQADTDVCLVALGGNDLLQGRDPRTTRANLEQIITRLKARHIGVVLAGLSAPAAIGKGFARDYNALFPAVARAQGVSLVPLLEGVSGDPRLVQRDGIHPNAAGVTRMADRLTPVILRALKARRR